MVHALRYALRQIAPPSVVIATEKGIDLGHTVPEPDVLVVSRPAVKSDSLVFQPRRCAPGDRGGVTGDND